MGDIREAFEAKYGKSLESWVKVNPLFFELIAILLSFSMLMSKFSRLTIKTRVSELDLILREIGIWP